ncbi:MAG: hypothetical protein ACRDPJ_18495 [Nocardioidaceae bacterium]
MEQVEDSGAVAPLVERLRRELTDRSVIEIATAVVDATDHLRFRNDVDPGSVERSARVRLSRPAAVSR